MTVNAWEPAKGEPIINPQDIDLATYIKDGDENNVETVVNQLDETRINNLRPLMKLDKNTWIKAVGKCSEEELHNLIRFFTLVEYLYPELEAGNDSPVIAFAQLIKQRQQHLPKPLLLWIKSHSNNRFLPHGSIL